MSHLHINQKIMAKLKYQWDTLEVGQSITIDNASIKKISPIATSWAKRNGRKFRCRSDENSVTVKCIEILPPPQSEQQIEAEKVA